MRIVIASLLLCVLCAFAAADSLEEKLEKELQKPFLKNAAWVFDFDEAKAKAKESGKLILGYFTRSYAP